MLHNIQFEVSKAYINNFLNEFITIDKNIGINSNLLFDLFNEDGSKLIRTKKLQKINGYVIIPYFGWRFESNPFLIEFV